MSDLIKDYLLGEASGPARSEAEAKLAADPEARNEYARLEHARAVLLSVPDEEPPRRIAFVSDKVFEAKPRPWFQWFAHPSFAAGLMLAGALLAHGVLMRPEPRVIVEKAAVGAPVNVDAIVAQAVARQAAVQERRVAQLVEAAVAASEKRFEYQRASDLARMEENLTEIRKYAARDYAAANFRSNVP
jgi:anti-sigma factor RsiW